MPETPAPPTLAPAAAANEAIRRFMEARAGRPLFEAERAEYARLVVAMPTHSVHLKVGTGRGGSDANPPHGASA